MACRYYDIGKIAFVNLDIHIPAIRIYANGIAQGILIGIPYTLMDFYLKKSRIYHYSLIRIIVHRTLIQFFIAASMLTLLAYINFYLDKLNNTIDPATGFNVYIFSATVQLLMIGALMGNIVLSTFRTLQMKVGEHVFWHLLIGKFRPAQEEEKAFLFIDLKSSTTIAEQLGHVKYSYFIQECFRDLHAAVISSKAQIYQYVGDEVVLTWQIETAIEDNNCIKAFFEYEKILKSRAGFYEEKFKLNPIFKAGLNMGKVMTAEVGMVKRDIAYHSDVLNTAARIQACCNENNAKLLVSEEVVNKLNLNGQYLVSDKGNITLRGKYQKVKIFEIRENNETEILESNGS